MGTYKIEEIDMPLNSKDVNDLYKIAVKIATIANEDGIKEEMKEKLLVLAKEVGHMSSVLSKYLD